jgi:hypothetical protein
VPAANWVNWAGKKQAMLESGATSSDPVLSGAEHVLFMSFSPDNGQTSRFIHCQPGLDDERTLCS